MLSWLLALAAGAAVALISYGGSEPAARRRLIAPALLRSAAVALLIAALLDAPLGFHRPPAPLVLLDVSRSWVRGGETAPWQSARNEAIRLGGDSLLVFGDSLRVGAAPEDPGDDASRIHGALLRAAGEGRSVVLITDGEPNDGAAITDLLPGGSRVIVPERNPGPDVAVAALDAPRYVSSGDSLAVRISLVSGASGSGDGSLSVFLDDQLLATAPIVASGPFSEQVLVVPGRWNGSAVGSRLISVAANVSGDSEPANDTLLAAVEVSSTPAVVYVSTSPDMDSRFALDVLRGTLALPVRAYLRVAPGNWRLDGPLTRVPEADVRRAVAEAPVVILHGDTAFFGAPRSITRGALALHHIVQEGGDWYPSGSPPSPLSSSLTGILWDSLPPVETASNMSAGSWGALETRLNRQQDVRIGISGVESPRRIITVGVSGLWRWAFRGGSQGDAFAALWGSMFDWLVADRRGEQPAAPSVGYFRAGESITWRRGSGAVTTDSAVVADSTLLVVLTARRPGATPDTIRLDFSGSLGVAQSQPLSAGVYDAQMDGGSALLAVNESRELLPTRATLTSLEVEGDPPGGERRGTRRSPALYVVIVLALCAEWLIRRRLGLR